MILNNIKHGIQSCPIVIFLPLNRHLKHVGAACHGPDLDLLDLAGDLAEVGEWGTASRCNSLSI